jgi:hypothetical protein
MKRVIAIAAVLNLMSCMLLHAEQAVKPVRGERTRTAQATMQPLSKQIRPDDQRLVLEINASPPLLVRAPEGERVEFLTDRSDVVLVIRVVSTRPQVTERENWIETVAVAAVEETLKPSNRLVMSDGNRVTFRLDGGTMQVNHATVEAVVPWARPVAVGRRYVLFGKVLEDGQLLAGPSVIYEEEDVATMRWLMRHPDPFERDEIEVGTLQELRFKVEREVERRRSAPR